ncbi:hypothetical protein [Parapedobacter defluvii]|nr:hypothetical protein [Parapedobacter defluvii]
MQLETTKKKAKGDRLNWTPLKDVKPVRLNADTIRGKAVDVEAEAQRKNQEKPKIITKVIFSPLNFTRRCIGKVTSNIRSLQQGGCRQSAGGLFEMRPLIT